MKFESNSRGPDSDAGHDQPRLRAFLIYQDLITGKKAKESCDVLERKLGAEWKIDVEMSNFNLLHMPRIGKKLAGVASKAHLVIISCHHGEFPSAVREWIENHLSRSERPAALVALLLGGPDQRDRPLAAEQDLAALAERLDMPFFSHVYIMASGGVDASPAPVMAKEPYDDNDSPSEFSDGACAFHA